MRVEKENRKREKGKERKQNYLTISNLKKKKTVTQVIVTNSYAFKTLTVTYYSY